MKDTSYKRRFVAFTTETVAILLRKTTPPFRKKGSFRSAKATVIYMNQYPRDRRTAPLPAGISDRTDRTVGEIMADWPMKGFAFVFPAKLYRRLALLLGILFLSLTFGLILSIGGRDIYFEFSSRSSQGESGGGVASETGDFPYADGVSGNVLLPWADKVGIIPASSINASHAALADLSTGEIIASRKADEVMYPASMTKVMTLIVVVENLPDEDCLTEEITISKAVYDEMTAAGSSGKGFEPGERLSVESLLYALVLESDGIAACELARYVAGSVEDFVELMNQKAEKMGLSNTHFENPTGLFHPDHKSTAREIASIMTYAMNMMLCRKVMLTQVFDAPCTGADGQKFNYTMYHKLTVHLFEKNAVHQPNTAQVLAGKTGFVDESRYCLVTYAETKDGRGYVCVTAKGDNYNSCVADYITIYNMYVQP